MTTHPHQAQFRAAAASSADRQVRQLIRSRAIRAEFFDSTLFADPAWDILLDLYRGELAQQRISVSSCCVAANVPPTTALRYIAALCERGLVEREADRLDGRRVFLSLTPEGSASMAAFVEAQRRISF